MSDSVRPHRQQPTRLPGPWDSPGKNTGVGCHFLLQCMKVKSESEVAQFVSDSSQPHGLQPTRLLHPWDFPGKSTGVGCHCLLHPMSLQKIFREDYTAEFFSLQGLVQFSLVTHRVWLFATPWTAACQASLRRPRVPANPCPSSWWCHPTISSSVVPFSSCPQSFPASGSFQMSQLFTSGGQSIGVSASTSVLSMNT